LYDFGLTPCGSILLDEMPALHIAFGRSDHFGEQAGASAFLSPESAIHIDRVNIPEMRPVILVRSVGVTRRFRIMRDGR